jgi:hypothetical protein
VLKVKADRGESGRTIPEQLRREIVQQTASFFSGLHERVSHRLQEIRHSLDGPAKPRLR